jgi:REP element-mobilizing transposase RayT
MSNSLLVVSPQENFGNLIAQGLPDYDVYITSDFSEAIQFVRKYTPTPPVLLDDELEEVDISLLDIGLALRQIKPDVNLVLIARENQHILRLNDLSLHAILTKPISFEKLHAVLEKSGPQSPRAVHSPLPDHELDWMQDVSRAARHLTRLMLESSAQAALITRQNDLWAYAGQLKREAAQELARSVQKYWDTQSQIDLLRFIRLEATEAQHMLYARRLTASMVLALVFDAETPFSTIRAQAGQLVRSLSEVAPENTVQMQVSYTSEEQTDTENLDNLPPIADLLGEVPPPLPPKPAGIKRMALSRERNPGPAVETTSSPQHVDASLAATRQGSFANDFSYESSPAIRRQDDNPTEYDFAKTRLSRSQLQSEDIPDDLAVTKVHIPSDPNSIIATRPQSVTEVAHKIVLEPASPAMYNLNYACLLVPRFDNHHLTGDLADKITEWVGQVSIAFGWRLEHISVRPEYLQWVVSVPPSTAPGYIMRIVRQQTSDRVFKEFPRLKTENPSGDFWAPGYLIMGGANPHPQNLVRDFIEQTRQRQGLRHVK